MRQKLFVLTLLLITAAYCWGLGWIAWGFSRAGGVVGWGLAAALVVLLALTAWVTWREVLFGLAAGGLARRYAPPAGPLEDPAEEFEAARARIQGLEQAGDPVTWQDWLRLAYAYDALRDRRQARRHTRRAIAVERETR